MKFIALTTLLIGASISFASAATPSAWAHVGNTHNSAIFVDRAVLMGNGARRPFRTLHINVQLSAGWRAAEHRGTIDCAEKTLRYQGVILIKTDGRRETLPTAVTEPVPFPTRGVMHKFVTSVCAGKLGPTIQDPSVWTRRNFQPG